MKTAFIVLALLLCFVTAVRAEWQEGLDRVLAMEPGEERDALVDKVAAGASGWEEIAARIAGRDRPDATTGAFLRTRVCTDGVERPWVLVVPDSYDPARPAPLFVWLHGLVTRAELMSDPVEYAVERLAFAKLAADRGWIVAVPMAQNGATWFDDVGMENLREIVRTVKRERNVDDDKVWMAGFSDGASAAFSYAMTDPTDYGAFLALNGHMGVASIFGKLETFPVNFVNTPLYAMTSDKDALYPTEKMRPTIAMAIRAGGRILFRQFFGGHDFAHVHPELDNLGDYLERHPRDPFPDRITWETADTKRFGLCRWLRIDAISAGPAAVWHEDHNVVMSEERVSIGFMHEEHEGDGVKVQRVVDDSYAASVGMLAGDILVEMNGDPIKGLEDLNAAKAKVSRGDKVDLVVLRGAEKVELSGNLPPPERSWIFKRERRSAVAKVTFAANHIDVTGSRVGSFTILVHPEMVNLNDRLVVVVNGEVLFDDLVEPDPAFLIQNYLSNRDRKLLYVAEVKIDVPLE